MAIPIVVKYNGAALDDITDCIFDNQIDGMGSASFHVPNQLNENLATWEARRWGEIVQIYDDSSTLLWDGYIVMVGSGDPLKISCLGSGVVSTYDVLTEETGKFIVDTVKVKQAPAGVPDPTLDVWTEEEEDPGWASDVWGKDSNYHDRYAIISDDTLKETSQVEQADDDAVTNCTETNDYDDTQARDGTNWELVPTDLEQNMFATAKLALGGAIDNASVLTKVKIEVSGYYYVNMGMGGEPSRFGIFWDRDQDNNENSNRPWKRWISVNPLDITPFIYEEEIIVQDGDTDRWLNDVGGFWVGGGLCFYKESPAGAITSAYIHVEYINITFYSMSANFEPINRKIRDVTADAGFDILEVHNDAEDGSYDLTGKGIAAGDKVNIVIGVLEAVNILNMQGLTIIINEGTDPKKGMSQNYIGATPHNVYIKIFESLGYIYFMDYSSGYSKWLALDPDDIDAATVTYSTSVDPPTWNSPIWYESDQYGRVVVQFYNGALTGEIQADTPSTNPRTKLESRPEILTRSEAIAFGKSRANFYATDHISIQLLWAYMPTNFPYVGTKYNFTDLKIAAGAIANNSFTNKVCRRTSVEWAGGESQVIVRAWIGLASTPADEKEERWKADIARYIKLNESLRGTIQYGALSRHGQLDGILTNQHQTRLHAITNTSDHSANNWKIVYTDGDGAIQELALGADDKYLEANGVAAAPTFTTPDHTKISNIGTLTHALLEAADGIGSGNTFWISLLPFARAAAGANYGQTLAHIWSNLGATDHWGHSYIPIPLVLPSGEELYLKTVKYGILDADAGDKINRTMVRGMHNNAGVPTVTTHQDNNPVTYDTSNTVYTEDYSGAPFNLHTSSAVQAWLQWQVFSTTAGDFDLSYIIVELYYA